MAPLVAIALREMPVKNVHRQHKHTNRRLLQIPAIPTILYSIRIIDRTTEVVFELESTHLSNNEKSTEKSNSPCEPNIKNNAQNVLETWYKNSHQGTHFPNLCLPQHKRVVSLQKCEDES